MDDATKSMLKEIAGDAARTAVHNTLIPLGIDPARPFEAQKDMIALREMRTLVHDDEFQRDMVHLRKWRKNMDAIQSKSLMTALGFAVLGAGTFIFYALKGKILGI